MTKHYVKLPARQQGKSRLGKHFGQKTLESHPDEWKVQLIGRVTIPESDESVNMTIGFDSKGSPKIFRFKASLLLLVFKDLVSGKFFWWSGKRSNAEHLMLNYGEDAIYNSWPADMYEISKINFNTFKFFVFGFGVDYALTDEEREKVEKQKVKLIARLKEVWNGAEESEANED